MTNLNYEEIREYIRSTSPESVVMIGCDSVRKEARGKCSALYSTVVCIRHATGTGDAVIYHGCRIFGASVTLRDYGVVIRSGKMKNLRMRLMQEVTFALEAYENISEVIGDRPFEIHVDINSRPEYESNIAMKEAHGYVMGITGHAPKFKPDAPVASFAADLHAHGLLHLN